MDKFIIEGKAKLAGEIEVNGSKNAAGALISATLLTDQKCVLHNVPKVLDILNLLDILKEMGCQVDWVGERTVQIQSGEFVDPQKIDFEKFSKSRVSVLLLGALVARFKDFKISRPGGDRIGLRPITTHLQALNELGVEVEEQGDFYYFKVQNLKGKEIVLSEFSVTATETLLMAVCLAQGETIIKIAAQEPHVIDLIKMLRAMGADIEEIGGHTLKIQGAKSLNGVEYTVTPDYLEAGTFAIMAALTGSRVLIKNFPFEQLNLFLAKLQEIGVNFKRRGDCLEVLESRDLKAVRVQALPHPGFPTDLLPLIVPLLTQANGKSLIHDPLYENRLQYTQELRKMGADIEIVDPHRAFILGPTLLKGVTIESWDIRAGASLVGAALIADGKTTIKNIEQIDRGYECLEKRLNKLGANIKRVSN